jgi:hypothetical protein
MKSGDKLSNNSEPSSYRGVNYRFSEKWAISLLAGLLLFFGCSTPTAKPLSVAELISMVRQGRISDESLIEAGFRKNIIERWENGHIDSVKFSWLAIRQTNGRVHSVLASTRLGDSSEALANQVRFSMLITKAIGRSYSITTSGLSNGQQREFWRFEDDAGRSIYISMGSAGRALIFDIDERKSPLDSED